MAMTLTHYFAKSYKFEFIKCYNDNVTNYSRISRFNAYYSQIKFHFEKLAICDTRILFWYYDQTVSFDFLRCCPFGNFSLCIIKTVYNLWYQMCWRIKKRRVLWVTACVSPSHMNINLYIYISCFSVVFFKMLHDASFIGELSECPQNRCPRVNIYIVNGDRSDSDCSSRFRAHPGYLQAATVGEKGWLSVT